MRKKIYEIGLLSERRVSEKIKCSKTESTAAV